MAEVSNKVLVPVHVCFCNYLQKITFGVNLIDYTAN